MSARFRRRGEVVTAVQFDGTNAEECARCAGDESGNHLEFEFRVGWWYLRMDTRATVLTDKTFSLLFEPVPLPEPSPADGWVRVAERLVASVQEFADGVGFCPCNAREDPCEHCHRLGMMLADAQDLKRLLPAPPVVEGGK